MKKEPVPPLGTACLNYTEIDSIVYELNSNWLSAVKSVPDAKIWRQSGAQFVEILKRFFAEVYNQKECY